MGDSGQSRVDPFEAHTDYSAQEYFLERGRQLAKLAQPSAGIVDHLRAPDPMKSDPVNHPSHYKQGGLETIDVIEAWGLDFLLGNCAKYISRAGKKDPAKALEDLKKAQWYLNRKVAKLEGGK